MLLQSIAQVMLLSFTTGDIYLRREVFIIGDGNIMEVRFFVWVDVLMHCAEDVAVTSRNVPFVPGMPFDLCSAFNVIQAEHAISYPRSRRGEHARWTRVFPQGEIRKLH